MKKKSQNLSGATRGVTLRADGHLSSNWLLLAIDGELSASDRATVEDHVRACWTCRAHMEHLERTIEGIVDYEQALAAPDMPPSAGERAVFMARLDQLADELGNRSPLRSWGMAFLQAFQRAFAFPVTRVACAVLMGMVCLYFVMQRDTQVVSANELLQRAAAAESRPLTGVNEPVTIQRLRIRVNGREMARFIYCDRARNRQVTRADASKSETLAAERVFQRSSLNWENPLSAKTYSDWRNSIPERHDAVTQLSGDLLRVDTTTSAGPVARASLTVRASDFHPIEESVRLRDDSRFEIAEVSYDVVGLASLSPNIFGEPVPAVALRLPTATGASKIADETQLAIGELQVRSTLHNLGADLGEQIEIRRGRDGSVTVEGIAADELRQQQLVTALQGIPRMHLQIQTVAQAAVRQQASRSSGPARVAVMSGTTPLLEASLKQRFPDQDQRTAYINQTLSLAQGASTRAWALNRLTERYTPQQIELLDAASRQRLGTLVEDHLSALREDINRLQNQLGQVLSHSSNTAAANATPSKLTSPVVSGRIDNWRDDARRVHSSVETVNESVSVLLTGSAGNDKDDVTTVEVGLRTTLTQLQIELQALDQQVHKQF